MLDSTRLWRLLAPEGMSHPQNRAGHFANGCSFSAILKQRSHAIGHNSKGTSVGKSADRESG